jgi:hypothetical protein
MDPASGRAARFSTLHNPSQDFQRSLKRRGIAGTLMDGLGSGLNFAIPHAASGLCKIGGKRADVLRSPILMKITKGGQSTQEPLGVGGPWTERDHATRWSLTVRIASYRPFRRLA